MLLRFSIENFKSFKEKIVLDMRASSIKDHNDSLIKVNKNSFLPLAAIFGANASGKSNLFDAFKVMQDKILGLKKDKELYTFIFDLGYKDKPTEFETVIYSKEIDKELRFGYIISQNEILEEWLFEKKLLKSPNTKEKCIYYRSKDKKIESELSFNSNNKELKEIKFVYSLTATSELIITNLGKRGISLYKILYEWFKNNLIIINYSYQYKNDNNDNNYMKFLCDNISIKNDIQNLINMIDPSIKEIKINQEIDTLQNKIYVPYTVHYTNDNKTSLDIPLYMESSGIKKIFNLVLYLFNSLESGITLLIDELDSQLHSLLIRYILRMYSDKTINTGGGQLIFSSQNLICLDSCDLRRDEIWFVEKNNQESTIFSLYDFKEPIRNDLDFGKHYLNGRFGAIPFTEENKK